MNVNQIQRQTLITLSSIIALTFLGFLSTVYFAHTLGPAPLGAYFLFLAYYGIFNLIGDGGFGGAAVKRISEGKDQNEYFSAFVFIRIVLLALSITALLFLGPLLTDVVTSGIFFWLLLALIVAVFSTCTGTGVYGSGKVGINQISNFGEVLFRVLFQIIAVFFGFGVAGLVGGFVGGLIAGGIANFRYLEHKLVKFKRVHIKNLSIFSFWIFLSTSGSLIFSYTDTILIGFFMNTTDVGIYRVALQLASIGSFATMTFQTVLYPKISNWASQGKLTDVENSLARAYTYSLVLAIPTCVGGWILGDRLLYFMYGASFTDGTIPLFFLLLVQIVNVFMYLGVTSLNALDHPKDAFWITLFASLANILLNVILIPVFGITGAALATLIAMGVNTGVAYVLLARIISVKIEMIPVKNIICTSAFMGLFLLLIHILLPLTNVVAVISVVIAAALLFTLVLFRLDRGIHDEISTLCKNLGVPWPKWL